MMVALLRQMKYDNASVFLLLWNQKNNSAIKLGSTVTREIWFLPRPSSRFIFVPRISYIEMVILCTTENLFMVRSSFLQFILSFLTYFNYICESYGNLACLNVFTFATCIVIQDIRLKLFLPGKNLL